MMIRKLKRVRLSDYDLDALKSCFEKHFLEHDRLWLFGSRADLTKKGGDIDLYIETHAETIEDAIKMRSAFLGAFEEMIGEQKIDIVLNMLNYSHPLPIYKIAIDEGVKIL